MGIFNNIFKMFNKQVVLAALFGAISAG